MSNLLHAPCGPTDFFTLTLVNTFLTVVTVGKTICLLNFSLFELLSSLSIILHKILGYI